MKTLNLNQVSSVSGGLLSEKFISNETAEAGILLVFCYAVSPVATAVGIAGLGGLGLVTTFVPTPLQDPLIKATVSLCSWLLTK
jgi:hypothetical protein